MSAVAARLFCSGLAVTLGAAALVGCTLLFPVHEESAAELDAAADAGPRRGYRDEVRADLPALYLRLGEAGGSKAADDMGAFDGAYPTSGVSYGAPGALQGDEDTAVTFDGTTGVTMPPGLDFAGTAAFSVELWAKQTAYLEYGPTIDHGAYQPAGRGGWTVRLGTESFGLERWRDGSTAGSAALSTSALPRDGYHHIVTTFDGATARLYLDGALVTASGVATSPLAPMNGPWKVGTQNCACTGQGFVGSLDEVAVYPRALGAERILAHFRAGTGS